MRIAIDIDDVLADFLKALIEFCNIECNKNLKKDDFFTYAFEEVLGCTKEEAYVTFTRFYDSKYFDDIEPAIDAVKAIEELKKKHDLYIITSRFESGVEKTYIWLKKHFKNQFKGVHFTHHEKNMSKAEVCKELGIDIMMDDAAKHAHECSKIGVKVILFDMPWNRKEKFPDTVTRVHSWDEALAEIKKIEDNLEPVHVKE